MVLAPRPGVLPARLVDLLGELANEVSNLRSDSPGRTSYERLIAYLEWAEDASQQLRSLVPAGDVQHLVFGGRYRDLLSLALSETTTAQHGLESFRRTNAEARSRPREVDQHPVANALLSSELDDRRQVFEEARDAFKAEVDHWAQVGALVVLDTSFYVEHEKLEDGELEDVDKLNARERAVPLRVAAGHSNRSIADELYLSPKTVEKHIAAVFTKLGLRDRTAIRQTSEVLDWLREASPPR